MLLLLIRATITIVAIVAAHIVAIASTPVALVLLLLLIRATTITIVAIVEVHIVVIV